MPFQGGIFTAQSSHGAVNQSLLEKGDLKLPPIRDILSHLSGSSSSSLPAQGTEVVELEEQKIMFRALRDVIEKAQEVDEAGNNFDLKELHASLEEAEATTKRGRRDVETLQSVLDTLNKLWTCNSEYLVQATEIIANGSRDRE
jgi:hypothetical protein